MREQSLACGLACAAVGAFVAGMAVAQTAPAPVILEQIEDVTNATVTCRVTPAQQMVALGQEVEFIALRLDTADEVFLKQKSMNGGNLNLGGSNFKAPKRGRAKTGPAAPGVPAPGAPPLPEPKIWRYTAEFRKQGGGRVICSIDPVICLEGGACEGYEVVDEPPPPSPPTEPTAQEGEGATRR